MLNWPHLTDGLAYEWRRIRRQGVPMLAFKALSRLTGWALWLLLLPMTIALHLAGYRRVTVFTERIGHLALEPDCLLKEQALGLISKRRWFILAPKGRVANRHLLSYWEPLIHVYEGKCVCFILASMSCWGLMRQDISHYILAVNKAQAAYRVYAQWGNRLPLLTLTQADDDWGAQALRQLGLPKDAWFVCVHVREPGFSSIDEELHAQRNGNIHATIPAMLEITRRGGWVIRIGDPSMQPLPPLSHVIDYAHHSMKCERLDVILCARAKFFLGNTSGIALVSSIFGVPCAIANVIPTSTLWFNARDISIPKLLWSEELGHHLRLDEIMASPVSNFRYAKLFNEARIRVEENSAEDIRDLAEEMSDRLEGRFAESDADRERQRHCHSLYCIGHHSFGSASRIGALFLRRHQDLLASNDRR